MASPTRLLGVELVDCARANAKQGIETTAELCGYGTDLNAFQAELEKACQQMRLNVHDLGDLVRTETAPLGLDGIEVAPDSDSDL